MIKLHIILEIWTHPSTKFKPVWLSPHQHTKKWNFTYCCALRSLQWRFETCSHTLPCWNYDCYCVAPYPCHDACPCADPYLCPYPGGGLCPDAQTCACPDVLTCAPCPVLTPCQPHLRNHSGQHLKHGIQWDTQPYKPAIEAETNPLGLSNRGRNT